MRNLFLTSVAAAALVAASMTASLAQRSEPGERPGGASSHPQSSPAGAGGDQRGRSPAQTQRAPEQGAPKAAPNGRDRATTGATGSEGRQQPGAPKGDRLDGAQKQPGAQPGADHPGKARGEERSQGAQPDNGAKNRQPSGTPAPSAQTGKPEGQKAGQPARSGASTEKKNERSTTGQSPAGTDANRSDQGRDERRGRTNPPAAGEQGRTGQTTNPSTTREDRAGTRDNRAGSQQETRTSTSSSTQVKPEVQSRFTDVISRQKVRTETNVNFSVSIGAAVPRSVRTYDVPREIVEIDPAFRGKRYMVVRDEIVIIEPRSQKVVAVVPRSGRTTTGTTTSTTRQSTSSRIQLAPEQRRMIRETVITQSAPRCEQVEITVGHDVPRSIDLRMFPEDIVRDIPEIRSYRFCVRNDEVVVIDPSEYRIVEVIE
jgi:hypothetical protein